MQHATERVERPGESQEALDGKNTIALYARKVEKERAVRKANLDL